MAGIEPLRALLRESDHEPDRLEQVSRALALLADTELVPELTALAAVHPGETSLGASVEIAVAVARGTPPYSVTWRVVGPDGNPDLGHPSWLLDVPETAPVTRSSFAVRQYSPRRFSMICPARTMPSKRSTSSERVRCPFRLKAARRASALSGRPADSR